MEATGTAARDGDLAWIRLRIDEGRIDEAGGEGPGVDELLAALPGLTPLEAAAVTTPPLAGDALHEALAQIVSAPGEENRVVVAMSGGVDSAVTLLRVRDAGFEPVGATLRLWLDPHGPDTERACCSPEAVLAARATCHGLGLPHVTLDLREEFRAAVVAPFVDGYARGETPNPCMRCNGSFRFAELLAFAERIGASRLATGHYARLAEHRGRLLLARAVDREKDQSYMLAQLDPDELGRLWFPLGESTKTDVRAEAEAAGLAAARRAESQEACFLAGGDYRDFLGAHGVGVAEGAIVDEEGNEVGRHDGYWRFTPGQRRGLGISTGAPVFALRSDPGDEHRRRGPARIAGAQQDLLAGRSPLRAGRAGRREASLPLSRSARGHHGERRRIRAPARRAGLRRGAGPGRRPLRGRRGRRRRIDLLGRVRTGQSGY